jgi:hypothetical protein
MTIELADLGYQTHEGIVVGIGRWEPRPDPFARSRLSPEERRRHAEEQARKMREFNRNVLDRVAAVPGVAKAAIAASLPLPSPSLVGELPPVAAESAYLAGTSGNAGAWKVVVSGGYFDVMGMTLLRGRFFDGRDQLMRSKVAIISAALERSAWPGRSAIGDRVAFLNPGPDGKIEWLEVIGVVNDVRPVRNDLEPTPRIYVSLLQQWQGTARNLIVRGYGGEPAALIEGVKEAVVGADAFAEAYDVRTLPQLVAEILYPRRLAAGVLAAAGTIGLTLASIGLYGVVSFAVARRRREIGIRTTLGASRRDILGLILREGAVIAGVGCAAGVLLGIAALRLTAGLIPDLPAFDAVTFVLVPALLTLVVLAACYLPARRASRVDPAEVLRSL